MAKETDPLGFGDAAKKGLEQTHQAMDVYFDFLEKVCFRISFGRN